MMKELSLAEIESCIRDAVRNACLHKGELRFARGNNGVLWMLVKVFDGKTMQTLMLNPRLGAMRLEKDVFYKYFGVETDHPSTVFGDELKTAMQRLGESSLLRFDDLDQKYFDPVTGTICEVTSFEAKETFFDPDTFEFTEEEKVFLSISNGKSNTYFVRDDPKMSKLVDRLMVYKEDA